MGRFYTEDFRVYTGSLRELLPSRLWISLYAESLKRSIVSRPIDFSLFWCVLSPVQSWIQHGRPCWKSTVAETGNKSATKSTVARKRSTLLPVLAANRRQREYDRLSRSTLLPIRSTSSPVCTGLYRMVFTCTFSAAIRLLVVSLLSCSLYFVAHDTLSWFEPVNWWWWCWWWWMLV